MVGEKSSIFCEITVQGNRIEASAHSNGAKGAAPAPIAPANKTFKGDGKRRPLTVCLLARSRSKAALISRRSGIMSGFGVMPSPKRNAGGYRIFGPDHLKRLTFVLRGRELGFSLDEFTCPAQAG